MDDKRYELNEIFVMFILSIYHEQKKAIYNAQFSHTAPRMLLRMFN